MKYLKKRVIIVVDNPIPDGNMLIRKGNCCYQLKTTTGGGLYLSPYGGDGFYLSPYGGDGLLVEHNGKIHNGAGLLLGADSPFKNIPILGLLL